MTRPVMRSVPIFGGGGVVLKHEYVLARFGVKRWAMLNWLKIGHISGLL
jgi:hypothetical protein